MNDFHSRRWNLGFIAMRWRHVFWIVPLMALLGGLATHFESYLRRSTAAGVAQIHPSGWQGVRIAPDHFTPVDVIRAAQSDEILQAISISLELPQRWQLEGGACVKRLREMTTTKAIQGTSLVEFTARGKDPKEAIEIWNAWTKSLNDHFSTLNKHRDSAELDALAAKIEMLTDEADAKREALSAMMQTEDLLYRPNEIAPRPDFTKAKKEFEAVQAELQTAKVAQITEQMIQKIMEGPVIVHEAPRIGAPTRPSKTAPSVWLHGSVAAGCGLILSVILAYLLELVFPRKQPDEIPNPV